MISIQVQEIIVYVVILSGIVAWIMIRCKKDVDETPRRGDRVDE